jgi:lycopene cyclase domain-containing protein
MAHYYYLLADIFTVFVPFVFSFHPSIGFYKKWNSFWPACLISAAFFFIWDVFYTQLGIWGFNHRYLCGIFFYNLPIEEYLFFICIPYASIFTFHCVGIFRRHTNTTVKYRQLSYGLIVLIIPIILLNPGKLYTAGSLGFLFLLLLATLWKGHIPEGFYFNCLLILLPFFIVNGFLTGYFTDEPIVWYNNKENLGMRMGTIPIEDIFFGMSLLLLNDLLYEFFLRRNSERGDFIC